MIDKRYDPDFVRKDACGAWIIREKYDDRNSPFGWEVDHIYPESRLKQLGVPENLRDDIVNLRPLNWKNNVSKGADYPHYQSKLKASIKKDNDGNAGIKNRDKSEVDKIYMGAWTDAAFASNEDPTLTTFYMVLNQQLLRIASPSYWQLLSSWMLHHFKGLSKKRKTAKNGQIVADDEKHEMIQQNVSLQTECTRSAALDFTKEYLQYCEWKKTAGKNNSIKTYCSKKGISAKDMIAWLRVNKPIKNNI